MKAFVKDDPAYPSKKKHWPSLKGLDNVEGREVRLGVFSPTLQLTTPPILQDSFHVGYVVFFFCRVFNGKLESFHMVAGMS